MSSPEEGVTLVVVRTVKPGHEQTCEAWLHDVAQTTARFPGHMGFTVFRPRVGSRDYTFAFRFDTELNMQAWESSKERVELLERAKEFTEKSTVHRNTGLETWFANPDAPMVMPPRWKMVVVTFAVAFPLIQLFSRTLGTLSLHPLLRGALVGMAMVLTMTYVAMPFVTKALRGWLYRVVK